MFILCKTAQVVTLMLHPLGKWDLTLEINYFLLVRIADADSFDIESWPLEKGTFIFTTA